MNARGMSGRGRFVLAAMVAIAVAACALPTFDAREGAVLVTRVERRSWNSSPEPGLFRMEFDAARMQQVRRDAANFQAAESVDPYTVEMRLLDREAERELKARGLCSGSARLASDLREGDKSTASGVFKCSPPVF